MAIFKENDEKSNSVLDVARLMMVAGRTAPKGKGVNNLEMMILTDNDLGRLASVMRKIGEQNDSGIFIRDSENILNSAEALLLIGTRVKSLGLKICGMCGFSNCDAKQENPAVPCVFNTGDLGIAAGSAVAIAADHRVDCRIMYTAGLAALNMQIMSKDIRIIWGIPLSVSSKNPFFDRK